ncbi:unnamed protein product [Gemmata massiliana]|uniref:Uncharacterized protein n=1 Tax=Gemmata massiliana TaxID=1210884 RepID=A0A6P2CTN5_9BACT|nr:unnamed protein product [Gemmata massiliana]
MERIAGVVKFARGERVRSQRTRGVLILAVDRPSPKDRVTVAVQILTPAAVPPAVVEIRARRPFADEDRRTEAVPHVSRLDARIEKENAVAAAGISPGHAEIRGQPATDAVLKDRRSRSATVRGASENGQRTGQARVRRVVQERPIVLVGRDSAIPKFGLVKMRQQSNEPSRKGHFVVWPDDSRGKSVCLLVVRLVSQSDLAQVI